MLHGKICKWVAERQHFLCAVVKRAEVRVGKLNKVDRSLIVDGS